MKPFLILLPLSLLAFFSLKTLAQTNDLKQSLTAYATFDNDNFKLLKSKGNATIYSAPSRKAVIDSAVIASQNPNISIAKDEGKFGSALRFNKKGKWVTFIKSQYNIDYENKNWTGTVSFWLKLNPDTDLEPGYCDPIQITDVAYNDASIWVDFTKDDNPRKFRLGVYGDKSHWDPENKGFENNPEWDKRLVVVDKPPFSRSEWTHICITYSELGSTEGRSSLYVNGEKQGDISTKDPFNWDLEKSNIYLGLSYIGLFDDLAIFNKPLSAKQIKSLYSSNRSVEQFIGL
ncbi:MAG: LamG domain-containing protein [Bacteroidota bacterium]